MYLATMGKLDTMKTIETRQKGMWVFLDMGVISVEDLPQEFMLVVVDGLDDEPVISREVEEGA